MRLSDLLGLRVRTESGERLGSVHDVRAELTPRTLRITGLLVGKIGMLERLGIGDSSADAQLRGHNVVPWSDVVRADRHVVIVRDGAGQVS